MNDTFHLERFVLAQKFNYPNVLGELTEGRKRTHWIWFIFPQLAVLGRSANSCYYGISNLDEARAYLQHPLLGARLREVTTLLLQHADREMVEIVGHIDALKVCSCMTLFDALSPNDIFRRVLQTFYNDRPDSTTLAFIQH